MHVFDRTADNAVATEVRHFFTARSFFYIIPSYILQYIIIKMFEVAAKCNEKKN